LEDPGVDGRIILRWILKERDKKHTQNRTWLTIGRGGGLL
jgi:hypothetical protein